MPASLGDVPATAVLVTAAGGGQHRPATALIHGCVRHTTPDPRGTLHWVSPGEIVLYGVRDSKSRTLIFRTPGARRESIVTRVPGVSLAVSLLTHTTTLTRRVLILRLFRKLIHAGRDPSALSDLFFAKLDIVLARRSPSFDAIEALMLQHDADC
jgi:hypothetical protein